MTEEEARAWLQSTFDVSRETWGRLERFVELLLIATHAPDTSLMVVLAMRAAGCFVV